MQTMNLNKSQKAMSTLKDVAFVQSLDQRKKVSKVDRALTHDHIIRFYLSFYQELEKHGIPFYGFYFHRSHALQDKLYAKGRSKAKGGQSPHNYGLAVDMVHSTRYWDLSRDEWAMIGTIGKEVARRLNIKVTWGGDWQFYDPAHWQLSNWKDLVENNDYPKPMPVGEFA